MHISGQDPNFPEIEYQELNSDNSPPRILDEVQKAIKRLTNNKSPRSDIIPSELLKATGGALIAELHALIVDIWEQKKCQRNGRWLSSVPYIKKGT